MRKDRVRSLTGFTLFEVLVSTLIFSLIIAAIYTVLSTGEASYKMNEELLDLQQESRKVMEGMARELRQTQTTELTFSSSSDITFRVPPQTYGDAWVGPIRYYLDITENQIIREFPAGTLQIIAKNINGLSFSLNNNLLDIQLTSAKVFRQRNLSFVLRNQVRLRND